MAKNKKPELQKKVPAIYSITLQSREAFSQKCEELGINKNEVLEDIIVNFIND